MHSFVTSKNVKWCHLIWPTLYIQHVARYQYLPCNHSSKHYDILLEHFMLGKISDSIYADK